MADGSVVIEGAGPWMAFEDGVLAVAADCSNAWSAYDLADGTVTFGPTARVPITCDLPQNRAVDDDLLTTLSGSATVEIGDGSLTVTNGSRTVVAEPTPVSPDDVPDLLLTNAAWNIQLLFVDGAPSPLPPTGYEGRLQFDGANVWFFVGCAAGRVEYRYSPDGLTLGPLQLNADSCDVDSAGPAEHVVLTLLTGTLHRAIHGRSLAIVNGSTILVATA